MGAWIMLFLMIAVSIANVALTIATARRRRQQTATLKALTDEYRSPVLCYHCGLPITETGTSVTGRTGGQRPVHIGCYVTYTRGIY